MENELISIIVPVFNTEDYIKECIDSVLDQSYTNWELLLVDDGSTDNSGIICELFSKNDCRIHVFHQKNSGQSKARNLALNNCTGQYYIFLDSDDCLEKNALLNMYTCIKNSSCDIVCAGIQRFGRRYTKKIYVNENIEIIDSISACKKMFIQDGLDSNTFAKLYKSYLWNNIRFPENQLFEDVPIMYKLILNSKSILLADFISYKQRSRSGSTTRCNFNEKRIMYTKSSLDVYRDICITYPTLKESAKVYFMSAVIDNYINLCCSSSKKSFKSYKKELTYHIRENKDLINRYRCLSRLKSRIVICKLGLGTLFYKINQYIK